MNKKHPRKAAGKLLWANALDSPQNSRCIRPVVAVSLRPSDTNRIQNQGFAVMKGKPSPMSSKKKTSERPAKSPEKKITPAEAPDAPPKARRARKTLVEGVVSAAKKIFKSKAAGPKTEVTAETLVRRTFTRRKKIEAPAILLEGDQPAPPPVSGPGEKYSLGPVPPAQNFPTAESELPESYGTKKLFLTARDPHWLYAHWDLTREQQLKLNAQSADGHLVLRIYAHKIEGHPTYEIHVHPESRHWFAHVERAGNSYVAELGYYSALGKWMRISTSSGTMTPPDAFLPRPTPNSPRFRLNFRSPNCWRSSRPPSAKIFRWRRRLKNCAATVIPTCRASRPRRRCRCPPSWTPQQEQALAKIINIDAVRRVWMGSLEITELIRRRLAHEISSLGASQFGVSSLSSPFGGMEKAKGFWFNVNAELIIYGATEPDAKVTLGGHEIKLRPDGSFSYRFSLPDGKYDLPAVAVSADGDDARAASLKFSRETEYLGDVGAHPQDPALKPPLPENL